ncbi:MAG: class II aldolase/adducin family protein, partial [Actinomycetota bacterium]
METSAYPVFADVEPFEAPRTPDQERGHRLRMCALGYRIFGAMRWGQLGDGHISVRDPELTDHFWLLDWGVPFSEATVDQLVLVAPDGEVL